MLQRSTGTLPRRALCVARCARRPLRVTTSHAWVASSNAPLVVITLLTVLNLSEPKLAHAAPHVVTISHWNVEWLFDGRQDPSKSPYADCGEPCADKHLERIAAGLKNTVLNMANDGGRRVADIVHLAEVEDEQVLERLRDKLGDQSYKPLFVKGRDTSTGQDVAILSRVPVLGSPTRTDERSQIPLSGSGCGSGSAGSLSTGVSKNVVARFDLQKYRVTVVGAHLKAFPTQQQSCMQREGQAAVLADVVRGEISSGNEVIVLGDLNDFDGAIMDANDNQPTSRVLKMLKDVDNDGMDELENVMARLPKNERYTAWYDRNGDNEFDRSSTREISAIDHILVSKQLARYIVDVTFYHSIDPTSVSDHFPMSVTFDFEAGGDAKSPPASAASSESSPPSSSSTTSQPAKGGGGLWSSAGASKASTLAFALFVGSAVALLARVIF